MKISKRLRLYFDTILILTMGIFLQGTDCVFLLGPGSTPSTPLIKDLKVTYASLEGHFHSDSSDYALLEVGATGGTPGGASYIEIKLFFGFGIINLSSWNSLREE